MPLDPKQLQTALRAIDRGVVRGRVSAVVGLAVRATMPIARVGDVVEIQSQTGGSRLAEVVGFEGPSITLMPYGSVLGIGPGDAVVTTGEELSIRVGEALLGRVIDGLGRPLDGLGALVGEPWSIVRAAPAALDRPRIERPLELGVRAIDGLMTVGEGQRLGLFAGSGVGKSTLLGQLARNTSADVVVVCLVGERGREVREFLDESLGPSGLAKSIVVCATSDEPALVRLRAAHVATAIAEFFRDRAQRVLLLVDSVTRFARAAREVGLAAGEPPVRRGYPPTVFAELPRLLERSGTAAQGSITALYTVLVEGSDLEEPIADEVRGILDGHVVLTRALGARGRWPAIDVTASLSRVMPSVTDASHRSAAARIRQWLALYEEKRDLVMLGAYQRGSDPRLDDALAHIEAIEAFLRQPTDDRTSFAETRDWMEQLTR